MLATSHEERCVFRKYAGRWLKIMERLAKQLDERKRITACSGEQRKTNLSQESKVYVPPYLLSLSNEFLRFEDASNDGSVTYHKIQEESMNMMKMLPNFQFEVSVPDDLRDYCEVPASIKWNKFQNANLLTIFGWNIDGNECVQCKICLSRATLKSRKRRITQIVNESEKETQLHLIKSHRVFCPYVSGFSCEPNHKSESGWKVIVSNLVRYAKRDGKEALKIENLWGGDEGKIKK